MALRDQPYIPIYIKDWLTDEKLRQCSANAHGVYFNIMCVMHKSEEYGTILLKQKFKQNTKQILNFASQLAKHLPFTLLEIENGLTELVDEGALTIVDDIMIQKRMVKDGKISDTRAKSGSLGGKKSLGKRTKFASHFAQAKTQAKNEQNTVYAIAIENENEITDTLVSVKKRDQKTKKKDEANHQSFKSRLFSDEGEAELNAMNVNLHMTVDEFTVDKFNNHLIIDGKHHKTFHEYTKHLRNWLTTGAHEIQIKQPKNQNNGKTDVKPPIWANLSQWGDEPITGTSQPDTGT